MQLLDKVAIITGSGSGIGRESAIQLAKEGVKIVVADIQSKSGKETVEIINNLLPKAEAVFISCDVTSFKDFQKCVDQTIQKFGRLDILFNNAGILEEIFEYQHMESVEDSYKTWKRILNIDLYSVILGTSLALIAMRKLGNGGVIINNSSMGRQERIELIEGGILPMPITPVYAAAKAGVVHFSRSLQSLAGEGIRVNAICPSYTNTPPIQQSPQQVREMMEKEIGGLLAVEDIAKGSYNSNLSKGVVELCKDDSKAGCVMRVTLQKGRDFWPPSRRSRL